MNVVIWLKFSGRTLQEVQLDESIRYKNGDDVEAWLNDLLCLNVSVVSFMLTGCPVPQDCELYPLAHF